MIRKKQFTGIPFPGILHQKAQRVDVPARGISYERPERYIVNTPFGQLEIMPGDWMVTFPGGNVYVIRSEDIKALEAPPNKQWWKFWRKS